MTLGIGTKLIRFDPRNGRLGVASDRERCLALLAVATRTPIEPAAIPHFEAAANYWERGDRALANLRLGTQSRGRAIATNPLTIAAAGTAAFFAAEAAAAATAAAAAEAAATAAAEFAPKKLTAFALRYLTTSGGRLGGLGTRQQLFEIARDYVNSGKFAEFLGDGEGAEEYIAGEGPGTRSSTYVDFTAKQADGSAVRIQTVDTLADGVTPTPRELDAAARIRTAKPTDKLILIPKVPW